VLPILLRRVELCHKLPFDRSSLTRWRQRLGEEQLVGLIQESLSVVHKTGALATKNVDRVVVDTTVQPKAIAQPLPWRSGCASKIIGSVARRSM
jgi:hypothetical protein